VGLPDSDVDIKKKRTTMAANVSITIQAPMAKVWEHLTRPELIKKYFFGTQVETDPALVSRTSDYWYIADERRAL
jgi:uncharacterized protein YndB with AHSA1/START domain